MGNTSKKINNEKEKTKKYTNNADLLKTPEDLNKLDVGNIENFGDILKNKTMNDLEKLPYKPYDLPSKEKKEETKKTNKITVNTKQNLTTKVQKEKKPNGSLFDKINSKENYRFLSKLSNNNENHFDLLKFKQKYEDSNEPENSEKVEKVEKKKMIVIQFSTFLVKKKITIKIAKKNIPK